MASRTLLLDLDAGAWSREVLAAAALPMHKLPELAPAGQAAGTMDPAVARELGYPPGVRLLVGGHELCCNALGAGVVAPQAAALSLASSLHLMPTFQAVPLVEMMRHERLSIAPHLVPGLFVTLLYHRSGGRLLRWFRDTLAPMEAREAQRPGAQIYPQLLAEMPAGPSPLLALPYFDAAGPPTFEPGRAGAILGLGLDSTRGEILKALLEAAAFPPAEGLEALNRVGISLAGLRAAGEGVRADAWLPLLADVLGLPIERTALAEPAPLGAALVAGVGTGVYDDYEQAVAATVRVTQRFEPDPRRHSQYRAKLTRYQALRARLAAGAPAPATD